MSVILPHIPAVATIDKRTHVTSRHFHCTNLNLFLLDLQVKMENKKVQYVFYKKSIANKCVIMATSALAGSVKRATLTQEAVRRLRNTDRSLPWSISAEILSEYSNDLRRSGYSEKFRSEVITAAIKTFEKQCVLHSMPKMFSPSKMF